MSYPQTYSGDLANLPKALSPLCCQPQWVVWQWVRVKDNWTKPPFRVDQPDRHAANNDPTTWGSHYAAVAVVLAGKGHGIGFALTNTEIGAVDLDHCRDAATGRIDTWRRKSWIRHQTPIMR
jgi:primase-polymerase (primpol)-like protein